MKRKIYNLDSVLITQAVKDAWMLKVQEIGKKIAVDFPDLEPSEIGDEHFAVLPAGTVEIFVIIRGKRFSMFIDPSQFQIKSA